MQRQIKVEEVREFLRASNRQFEQGGIYLSKVLFKRDKQGELTQIILHYENRNKPDGSQTEGGKAMMHPDKNTPHGDKPYWFRTRSNPVNRRDGQRARDNPQGKAMNANELNILKTDVKQELKSKIKR